MPACLPRAPRRRAARILRRLAPAVLGVALAPSALGCALLAGPAATASAAQAPAARPAAASGLLTGVNIGAIGYSSSPSEADRAIASAAALHVKVVRVEAPWAAFEPQDATHVNPLAQQYADRLAADAAAAGIKLIMTAESTPCWASSAPASLMRACSPTHVTAANAWPPAHPAAYGAFVAYLAARYGHELAAIEIWNEPDQSNEQYFAGPHKAQRYAAVLRAAYPAIKRSDPAVPVLGGSLVGANGSFLRALYAAGIKGYYDGLAVHFYTLTLASLRSIREVQLANGDRKPVWLDEFGWSSCWPRRTEQEQACVTEQTQATNLVQTLRAIGGAPWVRAAVVYKLQDSPGESFGLLSAQGAPKPAYSALARLLPALAGPSSGSVTLSLRRRGSSVLASGSGPVGDFMFLEAFKGGVLRYRAVFTLDRFNRYSVAIPSVLGTSGLRVRVFQDWAGPSAGAQRSI